VADEIVNNTERADKVERVGRLLGYPNARIMPLLGILHPSEIAQVLEDSPPELQARIIKQLPHEIISEALAEMDADANPGQLLTLVHPEVAASLIIELAPDDAADLLEQVPQTYKERILIYVPDEEEYVIKQLLRYDSETAGGLMNPEVATVMETMTKREAIRHIAVLSEEMEDFYTIYVVDEQGHLKGYLTFNALFRARNQDLIKDIMGTNIVSVLEDMDQEEVAKTMSQFNFPTLPVVDKYNKLLGRVTFDDILDVIEEENTEDILSFAGVSEDANLRGGWADSVRSRIPWLLINLLTASTAGFVISQFQHIISQIIIITSFMPIIAGVAGNGATQTLAVTIRRISTDGIPYKKALGVILKEVTVGLINGLLIGTVVSLIAVYINEDPTIGLVVFLAMVGNLLLAGLAGSFIPITLERLGIDPAVASSILITAITDILGYTLLLGLGTLLLL